jgi:PERQ amino acid-rich with GYF domain-containing protein
MVRSSVHLQPCQDPSLPHAIASANIAAHDSRHLAACVLTISTSRARRPNGATQTFRRTSNAVNTSTNAPQNTENLPSPAVSSQPPRYVPPHRNGTVSDPRYSKNQLLDLYRQQQTSDDGLQEDLQSLYIGGWQPNGQNGAPAAGWGRNDASREQPPGPDVCWDDDGSYEPLSMTEMDDEEREVGTRTWNTCLTPSAGLIL